MMQGRGVDETALDLGLTPRSIRTYLSAIFAKTLTGGQVQLLTRLLGG